MNMTMNTTRPALNVPTAQRSIKQLLGVLALGVTVSLGLSACSSPVKLNQPAPVESRTGGATTAPSTGGATQNPVTPVDVTKGVDTASGPAGVGKSIYFDYDSFSIKDEFKPLVDAHAKFLRANPARRSNLEGNTDERGGSEYNLALGQKRSDAVRRALVLLGVPDSQLEATSFGKEKPKAQGSNEAAWAENRRVDFSYR